MPHVWTPRSSVAAAGEESVVSDALGTSTSSYKHWRSTCFAVHTDNVIRHMITLIPFHFSQRCSVVWTTFLSMFLEEHRGDFQRFSTVQTKRLTKLSRTYKCNRIVIMAMLWHSRVRAGNQPRCILKVFQLPKILSAQNQPLANELQ